MPVNDKAEIEIPTQDGPVKLRVRLVESSNVDWVGWTETGEPHGGTRPPHHPLAQAGVASAARLEPLLRVLAVK